ncbi:MAG: glycosyltransferase family 2 protein [Planctomycetes bacterium]|nr:glycosyltransferase family 2 protein [Planctomycetota bacterium]
MDTPLYSVCNFVCEVVDSRLSSEDAVLSVVIPAYNEQFRLSETLARLSELPDLDRVEVIVVCDGCTDQTEAIAMQWADRLRLRVISYPCNRGKGYAVRRGVLAASGNIIAYLDADGATRPAELLRLQMPILEGDADIVIGSRRAYGAQVRRQPFLRHWFGKMLSVLTRVVLGLPYADTQCGCKLFRRDVALELFEPLCCWGFAFDLEILSRAVACQAAVAEMGVVWNDQPGSKVHLFRDGLAMLKSLLLIRLVSVLRPQKAYLPARPVEARG